MMEKLKVSCIIRFPKSSVFTIMALLWFDAAPPAWSGGALGLFGVSPSPRLLRELLVDLSDTPSRQTQKRETSSMACFPLYSLCCSSCFLKKKTRTVVAVLEYLRYYHPSCETLILLPCFFLRVWMTIEIKCNLSLCTREYGLPSEFGCCSPVHQELLKCQFWSLKVRSGLGLCWFKKAEHKFRSEQWPVQLYFIFYKTVSIFFRAFEINK